MSIDEFKSWLDGYVEGGGQDIHHVQTKAQELRATKFCYPPPPYYVPYNPPFTSDPAGPSCLA